MCMTKRQYEAAWWYFSFTSTYVEMKVYFFNIKSVIFLTFFFPRFFVSCFGCFLDDGDLIPNWFNPQV